MKFLDKETNITIKIVSTVKGLSSVPETLPKAANQYFPLWWKKTPANSATFTLNEISARNVKSCPSFPDYLSKGIIIPMWVDSIISFDSKTKRWAWRTSDKKFEWATHKNEQLLDFFSYSYQNNISHFVFKTGCPWNIITPKGYSVYQLPLYYHQNDDYSVLPGIIDTDYYHQINQQVVYHTTKTEIFIKKGTPFVQYIPFKRQKLNIDVHDMTEEEEKLFLNKNLRFTTSFDTNNTYLKLRKENNE